MSGCVPAVLESQDAAAVHQRRKATTAMSGLCPETDRIPVEGGEASTRKQDGGRRALSGGFMRCAAPQLGIASSKRPARACRLPLEVDPVSSRLYARRQLSSVEGRKEKEKEKK